MQEAGTEFRKVFQAEGAESAKAHRIPCSLRVTGRSSVRLLCRRGSRKEVGLIIWTLS